jgi:tRNA threonylcarbamoyladenosine modification (KEOPS) complex Cgi121 subunit
MLAVFGSSDLSREELEKKARKEGVLPINPKKVNSEEELLLADALAIAAMKEGRNIAKKEEAEFLLWLSAKTNIKSAFKAYSFKTPKELLLISLNEKHSKPLLLELFRIKEEKPGPSKAATPKEIERISLSRT